MVKRGLMNILKKVKRWKKSFENQFNDNFYKKKLSYEIKSI